MIEAAHTVYQLVIGRRRLPLRNCLLRGGDDTAVNFAYSLWVAISDSSVLLVDTGFDEPVARRRGIDFERGAVAALRELELEPSDVSTIVLTHLHFDHAGGLDAFPNARVHVQQADLDFYTGAFMRFRLCSSAVEDADIAAVQKLRADGRLELLSGDARIVDGVDALHIGGHTPGMQAVRLRTASRDLVLASDAAHLYANLEAQVPFPVLHDVPTSCVAFERLAGLAEGGATVVPGHDGAVMDRFERLPGRRGAFAARLG
ncbi:MAG TPA: N-acyl homoserine lactonase family protein [Acidothermaceae bacterium]|jgi:glyoxylase-like metal-dependent hydrolase (beta-lactamase superfamily II)